MNKLLTGVSALALAAAFGTGAALANPTVSDIEDVYAGGDIRIGAVEIELGGDEVDFEQEIEGVEGGSADGGEGGDDNWADSAAGKANAGNGGMGGTGGDAKARNSVAVLIENGNTAVMSTNNLDAENELSFSVFISTGDNDGSFDGGEGEGGDGEDAEVEATNGGEIEAEAETESPPAMMAAETEEANGGECNPAHPACNGDKPKDDPVVVVDDPEANAHAGNAEGGAGGYGKGGKGGSIETGKVTFLSGSVTYNLDSFQYAAGQFNVGANTSVANLNQRGNSVAAHVPVTATVNK